MSLVSIAGGDEIIPRLRSSCHRLHDRRSMCRLRLSFGIPERKLVEEIHEGIYGGVGLLFNKILVDQLGCENMDGRVVMGLKRTKLP